jgi:hypothetical protein
VAADGTVAVSYYDFRNNTLASSALTEYWLAYCHPSATTPARDSANWNEVRLTNTSFDLEQAPGNRLGDYEGLAAAGNDFVAVWGMPDGTGTSQESIFFRRAISRGSSTAPSSVRPDGATPLNQPSQPELGDCLTAVLGNAVATLAEHGAVLPGQVAFEIRFAAGIGPQPVRGLAPLRRSAGCTPDPCRPGRRRGGPAIAHDPRRAGVRGSRSPRGLSVVCGSRQQPRCGRVRGPLEPYSWPAEPEAKAAVRPGTDLCSAM